MVLWLTALACTGGAPEATDVWTPPGEPGPFLVGTEEYLFDTPTTGERLPVQVWFPASDGDPQVEIRYDSLLLSSAVGSPVPDCTEPRPLVMFSHGSGGIRYQSIFLTEHWATRGVITVAPDHVHNTLFDLDNDADGTTAFRRPQDIMDTYDWFLEETSDPHHPLHGCVDPEAGYQMAGHSFGAFTSLAIGGAAADRDHLQQTCDDGVGRLCEALDIWDSLLGEGPLADFSDPRATALLPMTPAGWQVFGDQLANITVPTFLMGAEDDTITTMDEDVLPTWNRLTATPRYLATLGGGANHFSYSNLCDLVALQEHCHDEVLDSALGHEVIRVAATAFLDVARGEERSLDWLPSGLDHFSWESVE